MAAGGSGATSNAGRIVARLNDWPGVSTVRADCGVGVALSAGGSQIMHLHSDDEAELRLTRPVVERLGGALTGSDRVEIRPGGDWIAVRLDTDSDIALATSLASVAIKANSGRARASVARTSPCGAAAPRPATAGKALRRPTTVAKPHGREG